MSAKEIGKVWQKKNSKDLTCSLEYLQTANFAFGACLWV